MSLTLEDRHNRGEPPLETSGDTTTLLVAEVAGCPIKTRLRQKK